MLSPPLPLLLYALLPLLLLVPVVLTLPVPPLPSPGSSSCHEQYAANAGKGKAAT